MGPAPLNLDGQKFGMLTALYREWQEHTCHGPLARPRCLYVCKCDCGKICKVRVDVLQRKQRDCGCQKPRPAKEKNPAWKGGFPSPRGLGGYMGDHRGGYVHVRVAEKALGKPLPLEAQVHHVDRDRANNRNDNLVICQDRKYHMLLHVRMRIKQAGGNPDTDKICSTCHGCFPKTSFWKDKSRPDGIESRCPSCFEQKRKTG